MGETLYLSGGGGGFTLFCFYEISHFLHGWNIPWTICSKTDWKNNCTNAEPHCNRCEFDDNWQATGQVHGEGGPLIPVAALSVGCVFAKTTGNTCFWF